MYQGRLTVVSFVRNIICVNFCCPNLPCTICQTGISQLRSSIAHLRFQPYFLVNLRCEDERGSGGGGGGSKSGVGLGFVLYQISQARPTVCQKLDSTCQ